MKRTFFRMMALALMTLASTIAEAQLLKGVVKGIKADEAVVFYSPDGYVLNNQVIDLKVDSVTGAFSLDFTLDNPTADIEVVLTEDILLGAHLEKGKTTEMYVTKTEKGVDVKFKGNEPKLNQWVNLWKREFDSMRFWSPDPSEAKPNAEYRKILDEAYAKLKKNSSQIKGHKTYDYYMSLLEADYKWHKVRLILDRCEIEHLDVQQDSEYQEIMKNVEINDTINYLGNLSLMALDYRNTVKPDETFEAYSRELMRIVDREVKLDCLRRVAVKLVGQNYFTFGKGHTDEQDKAFIADFMAFAGKDSTMAKTMIDEYYERKKSEEQTASGKTAPDITMETIDGKQVQLASLLKGKFTYIDVWATWCGPCCAEIPHLEKLVEKYKDNDKVQFISISVDTNRQAWENKLKKDNPQWQQYLLTPENNKIFSANWGITGIPRFILIDANGNVYNANASRPSNKETEETIDKIIK